MTHRTISSILKHDRKQNTYKIALLRALNDVVLSFPTVSPSKSGVAVPLTVLAEFWVAYYWPFVRPDAPIQQGARSIRRGVLSSDISFRDQMTELRRAWERHHKSSSPADGFHLMNEMRVSRRRRSYSESFRSLHRRTLVRIAHAMKQPVRYAGPGEWKVFNPPRPLAHLPPDVSAIPGVIERNQCVVVPANLWRAFQDVSLWVEALCIHQWCLFTEKIGDELNERGGIYRLLTERPDNRLPLDWERNEINLLMLEGASFRCPWTKKRLKIEEYQLDHIIPINIYPFNELWNLVPSDANFNMHEKRERLPSRQTFRAASSGITAIYRNYYQHPPLATALDEDVKSRFSAGGTPEEVARKTSDLVQLITTARNLATF